MIDPGDGPGNPTEDHETAPRAAGATLGAYEIAGLIAAGGMGAVYRATHRITGELRAVKVIRPELATNREFVARFMREVRIAATVEHPNLVRVYEPGMEGDTVFLPMELLDGATLADRIRTGGALAEDDAIAIVRAVGEAVLAVHRAGIIHRDLKPSNIFLARSARGDVVPKVLDLGAAKIVTKSEEETAAGTTIGSPHYMSFEQASGARDVDARTDQYSLGVVLYHALTGARPYENDDSGHALAKVLAGVPFKRPRQLVPSLSPATESAVLRALSRDRAERFPTLGAFLEALPAGEPDLTRVAELVAPKPAATSKDRSGPTAVGRRPASWSNRQAALAGVGAALVVGLIGIVLMPPAKPRRVTGLATPAALVVAAPRESATAVAIDVPSSPPPVATPAVAPLPVVDLQVAPKLAPEVAPDVPGPPAPIASAAPSRPAASKSAAPATPRTAPKGASRPCIPAPGLPCF